MSGLEVKTFYHNKQEYRAELSNNAMTIIEVDSNRPYSRTSLGLNFSEYVDVEDQKWIFNAIANAWWVRFSHYTYGYEFDYFDLTFAKFLVQNKIPDHLAIRLAVVATGMTNSEELFQSYRNLHKPFYFSNSTGHSSFEYYLKLNKALGQKAADFIITTKSSSLEQLTEAANTILSVRVHPDAAENLGNLGPESFEAFLLFSKFMRLSRRQDAMVVSRILAETSDFDWDRAGRLLDCFERQTDFTHLIRDDEKHLVLHFDEDGRKRLANSVDESFGSRHDLPSRGLENWNKIFVILIEKYGLQAILDGQSKLREDRLTNEYSFAAFVIAVDYIGTTGDKDTVLEWILTLSGELDSSQVVDDEDENS